jgi:putative addiction module component (TIGR02574 family)
MPSSALSSAEHSHRLPHPPNTIVCESVVDFGAVLTLGEFPMARPAIIVESEALALSRADRTHLISRLLDSLDERPGDAPAQVEKAWIEEAVRRYEAYVRGDEPVIPAEEVFSDLRQNLD